MDRNDGGSRSDGGSSGGDGGAGIGGESGSGCYPADSAGSRSSTGNRHAGRSTKPDEHGGGTDIARVMAEAEANIQRREDRRNPAMWLPDEDALDREPEPRDETAFSTDEYIGQGSKQLGLRLRPKLYERLCQVAEIYGVRPTTLARMMVIRGVNAVLDAEMRQAAEFLKD
jgi:hypothetical protein